MGRLNEPFLCVSGKQSSGAMLVEHLDLRSPGGDPAAGQLHVSAVLLSVLLRSVSIRFVDLLVWFFFRLFLLFLFSFLFLFCFFPPFLLQPRFRFVFRFGFFSLLFFLLELLTC